MDNTLEQLSHLGATLTLLWCIGAAVMIALFFAPLYIWGHLAKFRKEQRERDAQVIQSLEACASSLAALERQIAPRTLVKILRPRRVIQVEPAPVAGE